MEPINSNTILILSGSFLCVFLSLISIGGAFLFVRTRQERNSDVPAPQPPPVTRDVHAEPLGEVPTRTDSLSEANEPPKPLPPPPPPPLPNKPPSSAKPLQVDETLELPTQPVQVPDHDATQTRSRPQPLGIDLTSNDNDDSVTKTHTLTHSHINPITLPEPSDDENTPTILIDRSKPMVDDEET